MRILHGKKLRMSQEFLPNGQVLPVTIIVTESDPSVFTEGDTVFVEGTSKGKGFAGVVKRHGFHGHPASHGHKDQSRMPGSIGSTGPQRVIKGMKMAGRMGGEHVTISGLKVVKVDTEGKLLFLKGAVPGARNGLIKIRDANIA